MKNIINKSKSILNGKSKGMSVQSIIIGSVVRGVIARGGLAMLWPRVEKAFVYSEHQTINSIRERVETRQPKGSFGMMGTITDINTVDIRGLIQQLPSELMYSIVQFKETDGTSIGFLMATRDYTNEKEVDHLKKVRYQLENRTDSGSTSQVANNIGVFDFTSLCTGKYDCYYGVRLNRIEHTIDLGNSIGSYATYQIGNGDGRFIADYINENERGTLYVESGPTIHYVKLNRVSDTRKIVNETISVPRPSGGGMLLLP